MLYRAEHSTQAAAIGRDHELIARIVEHDEAALAELYDRFGALVFTIACRITGDRSVAEEVVQDVFFAIWRTAGGFRQGGSVAAWVVGCARHRAIDATRAGTFRARMREQSLEPVFEQSVGDARPDQEVERHSLRAQMRAALDGLAPTQRRAVELAYYGGLSHVEVAGLMGAPVGTTKTRLRLGLLHLRSELEDEHYR